MGHVIAILRRRVITVALSVLLASLLQTSARGQTFNWNDTAGGSFHDASNWTPAGGPPGAGHTAVFNLNDTYPVNFTSPVSNNALNVNQGNVTFNLGGRTYTLTGGFRVGGVPAQTATLTLLGGTLQRNGFAAIGGFGTGTLNVGAGATFNATDLIEVGRGGAGTINVRDGGHMTVGSSSHIGADGTTGRVNVTGAGSSFVSGGFLSIGHSAFGTLDVGTGASANLGNNLLIGNLSDGSGRLDVDGVASAVNPVIGNSGNGELFVSGAFTTTGDVRVAVAPAAQGLVSVGLSGATWNHSGGNFILSAGPGTASGGTATLTIHSGGTLNITGPSSTLDVRSTSTMELFGGTINTRSLTLGSNEYDFGSGTINVNGGTLRGPTGGLLSFEVTDTFHEVNVNLLAGATSNPDRIYLGGSRGTVTFTIAGGSVLTTNPTATGFEANDIGISDSSTVSDAHGILTVTGAGSRWNAGNSDIAIASGLLGSKAASGTLNVLDGGAVAAGRVSVGGIDPTVGQLNVRGAGSSLSTTVLGVGGFDTSFNLTDGATALSSSAGNIGSFGGNATANVSGSGATWTISGPLTVGANDATGAPVALLNIGGGGIVNAAGVTLNTSGQLRLNGGTLSTPSITDVGGHVQFNAGTIHFTGNWSPDFGDLDFLLGAGGSIFGTGRPTLGPGRTISVASNLNLQSPLALDGGTLAVGQIAAGGELLTLNRGTLRFTTSSLTVGSGGVVGRTLTLGPGMTVSLGTLGGFNVAPDGLLFLTGGAVDVRSTAGILNAGEIQLSHPNATLGGFSSSYLNNSGRLLGTGRVNLSLNNTAPVPPNSVGGQVRADAGDRLVFAGSKNTNDGLIQAIGTAFAPAEIEFILDLNNKSQLLARYASLRFGGIGLVNSGTLALSLGSSDITGTVTNNAGGLIAITGNSTATFYGPLTNNGAAGPLPDGELRVSAGSSAVFFGPVTSPGRITGDGAKFFEGGVSTAAAIVTSGSTSVLPAASLSLGRIRENSLDVQGNVTLTPGGGTSRLNRLTIAGSPGAWTGKLDLGDNALILDYGADSPIGNVADQIRSGRAGGTWTGNGINSSSAAARPADLAIGYGEASHIVGPSGGTFLDETVDATTLLIRTTLLGDANLDGKVSFGDFQRLEASFGRPGPWSGGDFNYDGNVGDEDFRILFAHFGRSFTDPAALPSPAEVQALNAFAAAHAVPEPGAILLTMAAFPILYRRAKRPPPSGRVMMRRFERRVKLVGG